MSVIITIPHRTTGSFNKDARSNVDGAIDLAERICELLKAVTGHESVTDEMKASIAEFNLYVDHVYFRAVLSNGAIVYTTTYKQYPY